MLLQGHRSHGVIDAILTTALPQPHNLHAGVAEHLLERRHDLMGENAQTPLYPLGGNLSTGVQLGHNAI